MDDLIVVILTLIIAAAGALGQLKKKKQVEENGSTENEPNSFWDMLREDSSELDVIEGVEEVKKPVYSPKEEPLIKDKEVNKTVYQFRGSEEGTDKVKNEFKRETKQSKLKSRLEEDFSLKKAVIYSEILNRKYT